MNLFNKKQAQSKNLNLFLERKEWNKCKYTIISLDDIPEFHSNVYLFFLSSKDSNTKEKFVNKVLLIIRSS